MNIKFIAVIFSLVLSGCQSSGDIDPAQKNKINFSEGTLANEKLTSDTNAGLKKILGGFEITPQTNILKTVIQQPVGSPGVSAWREMWIVDSPGAVEKFVITFNETGAGGTDFQIKRLNQPNPTPSESCPKTFGDYKAGELTSQEVQSCLGSPSHENYNPDGRYVYLYKLKTNTILAFVFDKSGMLLNTRGYKQD
ncbi:MULTISPECIES: hypothetical protein [unclassified Pseudomonas]|uniref:hypothetical protein n=1 Tax=unclassified Pseudomonas TaxID=196821 RepID=UPI0015BE29B2|nr:MULTISPECIES: hypothetical protein [unclassified Pseudomonas]MCS4250752.1 hypothetical protein [Pseudomonas sp. BIGb0164]NWE23928.1 hypothetical protein [Pseudomonas sp. P7548]